MSSGGTYTVCFNGTACSRDEGEVTREASSMFYLYRKQYNSDKGICHPLTGYIPNRIHIEINQDISKDFTAGGATETMRARTDKSSTVRGVGMNDFYKTDAMTDVVEDLEWGTLKYGNDATEIGKLANKYLKGDQEGLSTQAIGWSMMANALHGANLAAAAIAKGKTKIVFMGHSRGGVSCMVAASYLRYYGDDKAKNTPVYIYAIDPVPGPGEWYSQFTQLPSNVKEYVGVYAWDHLDAGFSPVVPRPTFEMYSTKKEPTIASFEEHDKYRADDPLANKTPKDAKGQPTNFHLYMCRGRHGTLPGNCTSDGEYDASNADPDNVGAICKLNYLMVRAYLKKWGVEFATVNPRVTESIATLRDKIKSNHTAVDDMGGGPNRDVTGSSIRGRPYVRQIASDFGRIGLRYYQEAVVGKIPSDLGYPVTTYQASDEPGWVEWKFL